MCSRPTVILYWCYNHSSHITWASTVVFKTLTLSYVNYFSSWSSRKFCVCHIVTSAENHPLRQELTFCTNLSEESDQFPHTIIDITFKISLLSYILSIICIAQFGSFNAAEIRTKMEFLLFNLTRKAKKLKQT